jgi:hypothetical protein
MLFGVTRTTQSHQITQSIVRCFTVPAVTVNMVDDIAEPKTTLTLVIVSGECCLAVA